jgi:hypothetical protein
MRKLLALIAAVLVTGLLVGSVSPVGAQAGGDETIVVVAQSVRFKFIDLGRQGDSPGDMLIIKDAVWNEAQTERVGTDWVKCTLDFATTAVCTVVVKFNGRGTLTGTGAINFQAESFVFPVTGGTGDFQHVTGEVHVTFIAEDTTRDEFHLSGVVA